MVRILVLVLFLAVPFPAAAACYADYKAKQDNPLRLHYGVIELPDAACSSRDAARQAIARRIGAAGWQLLSVEGIFDASGLEQRRATAGDYFLRF